MTAGESITLYVMCNKSLILFFFLSYFVGMCGDGANDCGVSKVFVIYFGVCSLA